MRPSALSTNAAERIDTTSEILAPLVCAESDARGALRMSRATGEILP
jgi:hypothetical protein